MAHNFGPASREAKIIRYVSGHPKCNSAEVARDLHLDKQVVMTLLWRLTGLPDAPIAKEQHPQRKNQWVYVPVKASVPPKPALPVPEVRSVAVAAPAEAPQPDAFDRLADELVASVTPVIQRVADQLVAGFRLKIRAAVRAGLRAAVVEEVNLAASSVEAIVQEAIAPIAPRKKVLVVGLISNQMSLIEQEFGDELDISFAGADELQRIQTAAKQVDAVFEMTKFISHSTEGAIRKVNANLVRVPGGMTNLRTALTEFYVEHH